MLGWKLACKVLTVLQDPGPVVSKTFVQEHYVQHASTTQMLHTVTLAGDSLSLTGTLMLILQGTRGKALRVLIRPSCG